MSRLQWLLATEVAAGQKGGLAEVAAAATCGCYLTLFNVNINCTAVACCRAAFGLISSPGPHEADESIISTRTGAGAFELTFDAQEEFRKL